MDTYNKEAKAHTYAEAEKEEKRGKRVKIKRHQKDRQPTSVEWDELNKQVVLLEIVTIPFFALLFLI